MALITCPECKKSVSSLAVTCPNCGCPIKSNIGNSYSVTLSVQGIGITASFVINSIVANATQTLTNEISNSGGRVTNIVNGQIAGLPLVGKTQTVTIYYEAPRKMFDKNPTVQINTWGNKPQTKWLWN